jgi:hypothetical protein
MEFVLTELLTGVQQYRDKLALVMRNQTQRFQQEDSMDDELADKLPALCVVVIAGDGSVTDQLAAAPVTESPKERQCAPQIEQQRGQEDDDTTQDELRRRITCKCDNLVCEI